MVTLCRRGSCRLDGIGGSLMFPVRAPYWVSVAHQFRNMLSKGFWGFFASTHATDPVITRLLGVLCLPDSVLSYKKLKHPCRLH